VVAMERSFSIKSEWDRGFVLVLDGRESRHASFAEAARGPLGPVPADNVFDAAYDHGIDTVLSFDGDVFLVGIKDGDAARVISFADGELWLARAIRATFPALGDVVQNPQ